MSNPHRYPGVIPSGNQKQGKVSVASLRDGAEPGAARKDNSVFPYFIPKGKTGARKEPNTKKISVSQSPLNFTMGM